MSEIVAIEHITIDGVFQGPARPDEDTRGGFDAGGWAGAADNDDTVQKKIGAQMGMDWSLLLGRVGYEDIGGFWTKQPPNPFTESLNRAEKFVAASKPSGFSWQNTTFLNGDVVGAVADLKQRHGQKLVIFGSGMLMRSLMQRDLVDTFVLIVHPLVLGQGQRLFAAQGPAEKLRLVDSAATKSGVFVGTYQLRAA
jgi:dihydrofolate reductase